LTDEQLSLDEKIYDFSSSRAKYNLIKLFENDDSVLKNPDLRDLITGKKFAVEEKKRKKEDKYDEEEVYSRFLNLRRRFSDEDEPIVLGPNLKEKVLPSNDKCGI
jgi:hypothetical protein